MKYASNAWNCSFVSVWLISKVCTPNLRCSRICFICASSLSDSRYISRRACPVFHPRQTTSAEPYTPYQCLRTPSSRLAPSENSPGPWDLGSAQLYSGSCHSRISYRAGYIWPFSHLVLPVRPAGNSRL